MAIYISSTRRGCKILGRLHRGITSTCIKEANEKLQPEDLFSYTIIVVKKTKAYTLQKFATMEISPNTEYFVAFKQVNLKL